MEQNFSVHVRKLYDLGRMWLKELWERNGCSIVKIETKKKTVGRHQGFILVVSVKHDSVDYVNEFRY